MIDATGKMGLTQSVRSSSCTVLSDRRRTSKDERALPFVLTRATSFPWWGQACTLVILGIIEADGCCGKTERDGCSLVKG